MSFKEACAKAAIKAGETGVQFFVYDAPTTWDITASFRPGWLFRAYPGGRKVLSVEGAKLLQEEMNLLEEFEENGIEYEVVCSHGVHFGGFNCVICHPEKMQSLAWLFRRTKDAPDLRESSASDSVSNPAPKRVI